MQDFIVGLTFMVFGVLIFFQYNINYEPETDILTKLDQEAKLISDHLMSEGFPQDWNESSVLRLGLMDSEGVLVQNKLEMLDELTTNSYDSTRSMLRTRYDYIMFIRDNDGNVMNLSSYAYGKPGINHTNFESANPAHLTKVSRFFAYKAGSPLKAQILEMVIYVWD